jgi:hypothetical protein
LRNTAANKVLLATDFEVNLLHLIRGLDVAGDELTTPTEAFAPALRWLRRGPRSINCLFDERPLRGLHLSIHAGEDYNHLLTGLRHIDETVKFSKCAKTTV